jgi:hypothetical protein
MRHYFWQARGAWADRHYAAAIFLIIAAPIAIPAIWIMDFVVWAATKMSKGKD